MKKSVLALIALFTMGGMCHAQLTSGQVMKPGTTVTAKVKQNKAPKRQEVTDPNYMMIGKAYYNEWGQFDASSENPTSYNAKITFGEDNQVTIDGIVDLANWTMTSYNAVTGTYDPAAHTITVSTPAYDPEKVQADYTVVGETTYYGSPIYMALFAGDFGETPDEYGQYAVETIDQLVFDVTEDLSTITARTGFGCYGFTVEGNYTQGFINFYKAGSAFNSMPEEAKLQVTPSSIHFEGAMVTVGGTCQANLKLINLGHTGTDYTAQVEGEGLKLYASNYIDAVTTANYYVQFIPTQEGNFTGKVTFIATNGSRTSCDVTAVVGPAPDFSAVTKTDQITFSYNGDYPFAVTDTIAGYGFPVAVSTNAQANSQSSLVANATVPEGKTGVMSWKGRSVTMQPDGMYLYHNNDMIYSNTYLSSGIITVDDISRSLALDEGRHEVRFTNNQMFYWYGTGGAPEPSRTWLWDFDLKYYDNAEHLAVLADELADFGTQYIDRLGTIDTVTVTLLNVGSEPLSVTAATGTNGFSAIIPEAAADYAQSLEVQLLCNTTTIGELEGSVTLSTTAGEFTIPCVVNGVKLATDYSPIVSMGTFSFNTGEMYPFAVQGDSAYSSIAGFRNDKYHQLESWLEASFVVPEGQEGKLSWDGHNSSQSYFVFMGEAQFTDGTMITIDGETTKYFADEDTDASSSNFDDETLTFAPGRHNVRFHYRKIESTPKGLDRFLLKNLALTLESTGVADVTASSPVVSTRYYGLDGREVSADATGIVIVRNTHLDGSVSSTKLLKK